MQQHSVQRRTAARKQPSGGKRKERRERRRLQQLGICLVLFLTVFVGKGVFPHRVEQVSGQLLTYLTHSTDFRAVFSDLGQVLSEERPVTEGLGEFCAEVFGIKEETAVPAAALQEIAPRSQQDFLNATPDLAEAVGHYLRMDEVPEAWFAPVVQPEEESPAAPAEEVPAVGAVLLTVDYNGPTLPEGYTMNKLSLGGLVWKSPLEGTVWSGYGYRSHPIDGVEKFHNGIDLGGDMGEPIGAFAAGTVEYVGCSDAYGNYFQLDHGDGVKSFYAHCSKICVQTGQTVELGQVVALVGNTGNTTGPHLHFELKCGGIHIDPAHYI